MSISYKFSLPSFFLIPQPQTKLSICVSKVEQMVVVVEIARFTHLNANGYCIYIGWPGSCWCR